MLKINVKKLYVWSIVFEPMTYFVLSDQSLTGVGTNVSRIIQIVVLLLFAHSTIAGRLSFRISTLTKSRYSLFVLYFCLAVMSGVIGLLTGVYSLNIVPDVHGISAFSASLNSSSMRPFVEYAILLYYIVYYAVFPTIFIKRNEDLKYFFRVFFFMFNLSLIVGVIGLFLASQFNVYIGRNLYELCFEVPRNIGPRFHGLFGEPRDAFVVLGLGAAFYCLRSIILDYSERKYYYILILICASLTQSTSGLLGIAIFIVLYAVFRSFRFNHLPKMIGVVFFFGIVVYISVSYSVRIPVSLAGLWEIRESFATGADLPVSVIHHGVNIYPMFWIIDNLLKINVLPFLFGGGLGSSAIINQLYYGGVHGLNNPHSNMVRLLAETGIIGFVVYIRAYFYPIRMAASGLSLRNRNKIAFFSLLVLSLTLAHRSASNLIFLGVFLAAMNVFRANINKE